MGLFSRKSSSAKATEDKKEKKYKLAPEEIVRLVHHNGGCLATDRITVDGCDVNYMYREVTDRDADTGWRFFAGDEDEDYMEDTSKHDVYAVNTIANHSPEILEYLDTPAPCAFERIKETKRFERIEE